MVQGPVASLLPLDTDDVEANAGCVGASRSQPGEGPAYDAALLGTVDGKDGGAMGTGASGLYLDEDDEGGGASCDRCC